MLPNSMWKISCLSLLAIAGLNAALELDSDFYADRFERMHAAKNSSEDFDVKSIFTTEKTYDDLDPALIIAKEGYDSRSYVVKTEDGYLLTMERIMPKGAGNHPAVLIQHGLLSSSADWLYLGAERALPFLLADLGYDVWLGNIRGNSYSRAHVELSTDSFKYWNFTFHEMGFYDVPAMTSLILKESGQSKLSYVGHSMGTTMFFVFCATRPELQSRISSMHALAPVVYTSRCKSPIKMAANFQTAIDMGLSMVKQYEMFRHGAAMGYVEQQVLKFSSIIGTKSTEVVLGTIAGNDPSQFDKELLPQILGHVPAGASTRTMLHYLQEVKSGRFQQFNEGTKTANRKRYGTEQAPDYDLSKVRVPIYLHYSNNDYLSAVPDVEQLYRELKPVTKVEMVQVPWMKFNHMDYLWAINAKEYVYDKIIELLERDTASDRHFQKKNLKELTEKEDGPHRIGPGVVQVLQHLTSKLEDVEQHVKAVHNIINPGEQQEGETNLEWLKLTMTRPKEARADLPVGRYQPHY